MIQLSFRAKLLLSMMALVGGITSGTLFVTHQKVTATYQKLFQQQFEAQVDHFYSQQELRLAPLKEDCVALAHSDGLIKALQTNIVEEVYQAANASVEEVRPRVPAERSKKRRGDSILAEGNKILGTEKKPYLRILNAHGLLLHPKPQDAFSPAASNRKGIEQQLQAMGEFMYEFDLQQMGYLAPSTGDLHEVIATKVSDPETSETLGAILLGFPIRDFDEKTLSDVSQIQSGIWFNDKLYSQTIPTNSQVELAKKVPLEAFDMQNGRDSFNYEMAGVPHRVFFRLLNPNSPFPPAYQVSLYSLAGAVKNEKDLRTWILVFSGAALCAAFFFSLLLSHGFSTPIRTLVMATREIRRGNFQVRVPVRGENEIGELAGSFNQMVEDLALKEKYHNVLNMVADKQVAEELIHGSFALGGEARQVTVLFCDIRGFTKLADGMSPEKIIQLLNEHFTPLTRIVYEHNGVVDKFVGDMLMAIFGAPRSYGMDALNAVSCASKLMHERRLLNKTSETQVEMGIGIATGRVVAGCVGSADRLNYTVLGNRVNLASRLCSLALPGQILLDSATKAYLNEKFGIVPLEPVVLKGLAEKVEVFKVVDV
jgi:class 3 adenylate cyclase